MKKTILMIGTELVFSEKLRKNLAGFELLQADSFDESVNYIENRQPEAIIALIDNRPASERATRLGNFLQERNDSTPLIVLEDKYDGFRPKYPNTIVFQNRQRLEDGSITKILQFITAFSQTAEDNKRLQEKCRELESGGSRIVCRSERMKNVATQVRSYSNTNRVLLIRGERGTGKTFIATEIHRHSGRSREPFTIFSCKDIPLEIVEQSLFASDTEGAGKTLFQKTDKGTLLLKNIEALTSLQQAKLLKIITENRTGNARLIMSSPADLENLVAENAFREDLLEELNRATITLPSLDKRREDITALANAFARSVAIDHGIPFSKLTRQAIARLQGRDYPGNVAELYEAITEAVLLCRNDEIEVCDVPGNSSGGSLASMISESPGSATLEEVECEAIRQTLSIAGGNMLRAAKLLHISRSTLYSKVKKHGLDRRGRIIRQ